MINKATETTPKKTRAYVKSGKFSKRRGPKARTTTSWDANNVLAAINYLNDLNDADRNKAISFFN